MRKREREIGEREMNKGNEKTEAERKGSKERKGVKKDRNSEANE